MNQTCSCVQTFHLFTPHFLLFCKTEIFKSMFTVKMTDTSGAVVNQEDTLMQNANNTASSNTGNMSNVLAHIAQLEQKIEALSNQNKQLNVELEQKDTRIKNLSEKTQEAMQSFAETLLKKWVDACETKNPEVKEDFINGVNNIIKNSDETNGVWQMMVAASSLHERQEHDLEKLRLENTELKTRVDNLYSDSSSRIDTRANLAGSKRGAETQLDRSDVSRGNETEFASMWDDFAKSMSHF